MPQEQNAKAQAVAAFFPTIGQMLGPLLYLRLMCGGAGRPCAGRGAVLFCYASAAVDGVCLVMLAVAWAHRGSKAAAGSEDGALHQPMYEESGAAAPENWHHTDELVQRGKTAGTSGWKFWKVSFWID